MSVEEEKGIYSEVFQGSGALCSLIVASQFEGPRQVASVSSGSLLEMQHLRPCPRTLDRDLHFYSILRSSVCTFG